MNKIVNNSTFLIVIRNHISRFHTGWNDFKFCHSRIQAEARELTGANRAQRLLQKKKLFIF